MACVSHSLYVCWDSVLCLWQRSRDWTVQAGDLLGLASLAHHVAMIAQVNPNVYVAGSTDTQLGHSWNHKL